MTSLMAGKYNIFNRLLIAKTLLVMVFCIGATLGFGSEDSRLWDYWDVSSAANNQDIDHSAWNRLLEKYVITNHPSGINRFRYGDMTAEDVKKLDAYIKSLASQDPRLFNKNVQKAYWINFYNALVVQLVEKNYPVESIEDISGKGFTKTGPWHIELVKIKKQWLTLDDIENRILRPIWQDYRIHFALSCASLGCPDLQPLAFTADNTSDLLLKAGRDFVGHDRGVQIEKGNMTISKIFEQYRDDFATDEKTLKKLLAHYAMDRQALYLLGHRGNINYSYDSGLNAP